MKNMIGTGNALERLKKLIPPGVQPKFGSVDEWRAWQAEEGRKRCEELEKQNQRARAEKIFGRARNSGSAPRLHIRELSG